MYVFGLSQMDPQFGDMKENESSGNRKTRFIAMLSGMGGMISEGTGSIHYSALNVSDVSTGWRL